MFLIANPQIPGLSPGRRIIFFLDLSLITGFLGKWNLTPGNVFYGYIQSILNRIRENKTVSIGCLIPNTLR